MEENFSIGIIGGKGKMGEFFKNFFEKKGYRVLISDRETNLTNIELVKNSKMILISVPMDVFPQVVKEISPYIKRGHWVMDVCSLKLEPYKVMREFLREGEVIATHPLFGPYEKSLSQKTIAYFPIRGKNFLSWFKKTMTEEGVYLIKIPPKKHDQMMALIQVINHFWLILLGRLIIEARFDLETLVNLSTPSFIRQLDILKRLAYQEADLYAKIQLENPWGKKLRNLLLKTCKKMVKEFDSLQGEERFKSYFNEVKTLAKNLEFLLRNRSFD